MSGDDEAPWPQLARLQPAPQALQHASDLIQARSPVYTSVFLYALEGDTLVLRAFTGRATEHTRIRVGEGVCGRAVAVGESQLVADVTTDADYISCSLGTRSECVVLVRRDGRIVGQIDIDSDLPAAFGPEDVRMMEAAAELIAPLF